MFIVMSPRPMEIGLLADEMTDPNMSIIALLHWNEVIGYSLQRTC